MSEDFFSKMLSGWSGYSELKQFVQGGQLAETLEAIGDTHYQAGIRSLRDAADSAWLEREVGMAASQFRVAYEAFYRSARSKLRVLGVASLVGMPLAFKSYEKAYRREAEAAIAAAHCYAMLREKQLTEKFVERASVAFGKYMDWRSAGDTGAAGGSLYQLGASKIFADARTRDVGAFKAVARRLLTLGD